MQIKKDEMKNNLLDAASYEFMKHGFEKASVRNIVKSANTTIGNFYNYFKTKEDIFCALVDEVYLGLVYLLKNHDSAFDANAMLTNTDISTMRQILSGYLAQALPRLNDRFLLLLEKSQGTKYSHVKSELIDMMGEHFLIHIREQNPSYQYPQMGKILAKQLLDGMLEILTTEKQLEQKLQLLTEYTIYTIVGMTGILQGGNND